MAEETKETEQVVEENEDKQEPETKESAIEKIGTKVKEFFSSKENKDSEEQLEVPEEFASAVQEMGWSDDEVLDFILDEGKSIYTNEELIEMIPMLKGEDSTEVEEISDNPEKDETKETKDEDSQDDEKKELLARIEALEKAQGKQKEDDKKQEVSNLVQRASQVFDNTSKEFEVFGTTEKLPKFPDGRIIPNSPQMKARSEVWSIGTKLYNSGLDFDSAMSVAIDAYKGKNLSKEIERNVIKGLKKREKKLSGKRVRHESVNTEMSGPEVVKEILKKHGRA